ncbi:hypothetical protein Tco_0266901 [Tanacetum coccineum]
MMIQSCLDGAEDFPRLQGIGEIGQILHNYFGGMPSHVRTFELDEWLRQWKKKGGKVTNDDSDTWSVSRYISLNGANHTLYNPSLKDMLFENERGMLSLLRSTVALLWLDGLQSRCIVARVRLGDRSYRMQQLRCRTRVGMSIKTYT